MRSPVQFISFLIIFEMIHTVVHDVTVVTLIPLSMPVSCSIFFDQIGESVGLGVHPGVCNNFLNWLRASSWRCVYNCNCAQASEPVFCLAFSYGSRRELN